MTSPSSIRLAALLLATGLALSACDRRTPTSVALRQASIKLHAMSPDGTSGPATSDRAKTYSEVLTSLKSVADQGQNGETGSAYLLIAQAQSGLAQAPATEAAQQERLSLDEGQGVRDSLAQWLNANALADASAAYDPAKELADIDAQVKEKLDLRVAEQQRKAGVDGNVADILKQAKEKSDQAKAKRQEAGALKSQLANQTATKAEATLKQATEIGRVADGLEVEASTLEAKAAQIAPQSGEIQLQIDKLSSQKDLLDASRTAVQKRAGSAKANATEARTAAAAAAAEIKKRLTALESRRDGDLAKATEGAITGYTAAANAAKKAGADAKGTAQTAMAAAQQSLGDALWNKAHGLSEYAGLLDALANAKPALPDAGQYKAKAAKAREDAKAALDQATEAYSSANDAYKSGGGASMKERLDSVNKSLAEIVKATSGGSKDIRDPDAPKDEAPATATPSETTAAAATVEAGSPQATLQAFFDLSKGVGTETGADLFATGSEQDKQLLKSALAITPKFMKLDEAMKAKFGKGLVDAAKELGAPGGSGPGVDLDQYKDLSAAKVDVKVDGSTATAPLPSGQTIKLVKKDGKWLIDPDSAGMDQQKLAMLQMLAGPLSKAVDELTPEVQAGKYADAKSVLLGLQQKVAGGALPKAPGGKK